MISEVVEMTLPKSTIIVTSNTGDKWDPWCRVPGVFPVYVLHVKPVSGKCGWG